MGIKMVSGDSETHIFFVSEFYAESRAILRIYLGHLVLFNRAEAFDAKKTYDGNVFHFRRQTLLFPKRLELAVFIGKEVGELSEDGNHCCECSTFFAAVPGHLSFEFGWPSPHEDQRARSSACAQ